MKSRKSTLFFPDTGKKVGALFGFAFIGEKRVTDNAIMFRGTYGTSRCRNHSIGTSELLIWKKKHSYPLGT